LKEEELDEAIEQLKGLTMNLKCIVSNFNSYTEETIDHRQAINDIVKVLTVYEKSFCSLIARIEQLEQKSTESNDVMVQ